MNIILLKAMMRIKIQQMVHHQKLNKLVKTGKIAALKRYRAQIFLYADKGDDGPCLSDPQIAKKLEISVITEQRARQRLIEKGLDSTLERVKREKGPNPKKLDPEQEAKLISQILAKINCT